MNRTDLTFISGGVRCAAWFYPSAGNAATSPCVILAHGLGGTRAGRLDAFAERFAAAGIAALAFDYRYFGDSEGTPRHLTGISSQQRDWRAAIAHARTLDGVDPDRIALWGTSLSGGHVTVLAAEPGIEPAAVVAMNPMLDGRTGLRSTPPRRALTLTRAALRDTARALTGRDPHLIPVIGGDGATAVMAGGADERDFLAMFPDGPPPSCEISARVLLRLPHYRPLTRAARVTCPWLLQTGTGDPVTPPGPVHRAVAAAPRARMSLYDGGHSTPTRAPPSSRSSPSRRPSSPSTSSERERRSPSVRGPPSGGATECRGSRSG